MFILACNFYTKGFCDEIESSKKNDSSVFRNNFFFSTKFYLWYYPRIRKNWNFFFWKIFRCFFRRLACNPCAISAWRTRGFCDREFEKGFYILKWFSFFRSFSFSMEFRLIVVFEEKLELYFETFLKDVRSQQSRLDEGILWWDRRLEKDSVIFFWFNLFLLRIFR